MHFLQTHFLAKVRPQEMKIEYFSCPHPSLRPGIDITTCSRYVMTNLQNVHIFANAFFSRQSAFRRSQIFFEKDFFKHNKFSCETATIQNCNVLENTS